MAGYLAQISPSAPLGHDDYLVSNASHIDDFAAIGRGYRIAAVIEPHDGHLRFHLAHHAIGTEIRHLGEAMKRGRL